MKYYLIQFILGYFATMSFSFIYNTPKKMINSASVVGGLGWIINKYIFLLTGNMLLPGFIAAFVIGSLSEILARKKYTPSITFFIPAIIPLVPGAGMYYTMYNLILQDYIAFAQKGIETFTVALAIAMGIYLSTSLSNSIKGLTK
ncbi:MAG: threonine/serine exporter [Tissierellia bacterium]|nr:threonine/serine exporter [Tissierellia bacterium]